MNIRQAILKTADLFEQSPSSYFFLNARVPTDCGSPGCVVGHIACCMGAKDDISVYGPECEDVLGVGYDTFFGRMVSLSEADNFKHGAFTSNAQSAAAYLRQYADKYHPIHDHIPAAVREIFTEPVAA